MGDYSDPPIHKVNKRRQEKGNFFDNLGDLPLSDFHCKAMLNDSRFEIGHISCTHRSEAEFQQNENIKIVDSDGNPTPEEKLDVRGILIQYPDGDWGGVYYHFEIRAWVDTFYHEDKEKAGLMHEAYAAGYEAGVDCANAKKEAVVSNPTITVHDMYG